MDSVLLAGTINKLSYSNNSYLRENKICYNNFDINIIIFAHIPHVSIFPRIPLHINYANNNKSLTIVTGK